MAEEQQPCGEPARPRHQAWLIPHWLAESRFIGLPIRRQTAHQCLAALVLLMVTMAGGSESGAKVQKRPCSRRYILVFANLAARVLHGALLPSAIHPNEVRSAAPELSEAIRCRGTEILIQGNTAIVALPAHPLLLNPGFDDFHDHSPAGWGHDKLGVITARDADSNPA